MIHRHKWCNEWKNAAAYAAGQDPVIPATNVDWAQAPFVFKQFGEDDGHTFSCPSIRPNIRLLGQTTLLPRTYMVWGCLFFGHGHVSFAIQAWPVIFYFEQTFIGHQRDRLWLLGHTLWSVIHRSLNDRFRNFLNASNAKKSIFCIILFSKKSLAE